MIGDGLRARRPAGQGSEVVLALCDPQSDDRPRPTRVVSPRQGRILSVGIVRARDDSCNNVPWTPHLASDGAEPQVLGWYRRAKATKRGGMGGEESACLIVCAGSVWLRRVQVPPVL